jgi:hypothetical protein
LLGIAKKRVAKARRLLLVCRVAKRQTLVLGGLASKETARSWGRASEETRLLLLVGTSKQARTGRLLGLVVVSEASKKTSSSATGLSGVTLAKQRSSTSSRLSSSEQSSASCGTSTKRVRGLLLIVGVPE